MRGLKYDKSKPPYDLIPNEALEAAALALDFGAKKYAPFNWCKGIEYRRLIAAAMRHINQFNAGEDLDAESGVNHVGHAMCCLMFLSWMQVHRKDLDDRGFKAAVAGPSLQIGGQYINGKGCIVTIEGAYNEDVNYMYQCNNGRSYNAEGTCSTGLDDDHLLGKG